jgi:RNA polymerase sigma factor (sigma-70 family)
MTRSYDETCWTMVKAARAGEEDARGVFSRTYLPVIRAYLGARWKSGAYLNDLEDVVQEVFLECFRENGALVRLDPERGVNFRTFLYAVVRNVALRHEERRARNRELQAASTFDPAAHPGQDERLSLVFDRAWATTLLKKAAERQRRMAEAAGPRAVQRVELLRLRIHDGKPIRDIARDWDQDPAFLHHEYARAREEFKQALRDEVAFHRPGAAGDVDRECAVLLALVRRS